MKYDAIIIGAGHNGLVCAFYLARAGMKVLVLERRGVVGGAAVTEEFHPGFRNSVASYAVSLLNPKVIADMNLCGHGLTMVERTISNFLPLPEGGGLRVGGGLERTQAEVARFSRKDAEALPAYYNAVDQVADVLRDLVLKAPPNAGGGFADFVRLAGQARGMAKLDLEGQRTLMDLFALSAREFLDRWFESDPIKAVFGFDAVVGNFASPNAPGSAYVLLHHLFGEVNGKKGAWGHALGGMGSITQAMKRACEERGVTIRTDTPVARVVVKNKRAVGVVTEGGEEILADRVVGNLHPKLLYTKLLDAADLDAPFARRIGNYVSGSGTFRMNVALSELPKFKGMPDEGDHLGSGVIIAPSLAYMDRAYEDAKAKGWSDKPIIEVLLPSVLDTSLAPPGQHVAALFCQHFAPQLPDGRSWDDVKERAADHIIDTVTQCAPNFKSAILGRMVLSPLDLERKFSLVGGDIMHGRMSLDQLWAARPVLGVGAYRAPIAGLYMCGAGTHPGGGVTGAPGHNAAKEILHDRSLLGRIAPQRAR
ncbi:MAG TPA: NAD(P)/FAD-dependent oxidoreductase [Rhizomicrobium sp.]|jgi:phytoene dehydrogenase-like protein|nr:NAD(P)/FAD-dependent oxidoreductase [Rhizomicrobium sp.]